MTEREKELRAVYALAARFAKTEADLATLLQDTAAILQGAMRFPDRCGVEIGTLRRRASVPSGLENTGLTPALDEYEVMRSYGDQYPLQLRVCYYRLPEDETTDDETPADELYRIEDWEHRLIESCASLLADVLQRREMDETLRETTKQLQVQAAELAGKNSALREVLSQIENEKRLQQERASAYITTYVRPELEQLKMSDCLDDASRSRIEAVVAGLDEVFSDNAWFLLELGRLLTQRELEIAELIRRGCSSKEIARRLQLSPGTVERHRNTIRKKLNLTNQDLSLVHYLRSGSM